MELFLTFATAEDTIREIENQVLHTVLYTVIFCGVGQHESKFREKSKHTLLKSKSEKTEEEIKQEIYGKEERM
jgi:hypothetical protein